MKGEKLIDTETGFTPSAQLNKQDLFILMDSYKNNIQLNSTLLEQQKQMLTLHAQTIETQKEVMERQKELCSNIDDLVEKLTNCSKILADNHSKLSLDIGNVVSNISKCQSSLSVKLYICLGGMISVLLSVIGLATVYADKIKVLNDLIVRHIAK